MSFLVAPAESGSALASLRHQVTLCEWSPASAELSARVGRLIEHVLCPCARAFRPEVGLDAVARETRFSAQAQDRKQTQRPLLLRGYGDRASLVAQGERSQKLEDQHFPATRAL